MRARHRGVCSAHSLVCQRPHLRATSSLSGPTPHRRSILRSRRVCFCTFPDILTTSRDGFCPTNLPCKQQRDAQYSLLSLLIGMGLGFTSPSRLRSCHCLPNPSQSFPILSLTSDCLPSRVQWPAGPWQGLSIGVGQPAYRARTAWKPAGVATACMATS